jgi:hypothetical protein
MFGRLDLCDFVLEHPTISRFHAGMLLMITNSCSQFDIYIYVLGIKMTIKDRHIHDTDM